MYDLQAYGAMVLDQVRVDAYEQALGDLVTEDSVVLDLGAGFGILSLLAARLGARRVIAIEPNPLVRIGPRLAAENGLADRITFVHGRSQQIELARKADIVVSDLRGALPVSSHLIETLADARERLLAPGGTLIPVRDTLFTAPIQAGEAYTEILSPWQDKLLGFKMTAAAHAALNQGLVPIKSFDQLLGEPRKISDQYYSTAETPAIDATVNLHIGESGVMHGLSVWFETELIPGIVYSSAPGEAETVYGRLILPMPEPLDVKKGDKVRAAIKVAIDGGRQIWVWKGRVQTPEGKCRSSFVASTGFFNPKSPIVREVWHSGSISTVSTDGVMTFDVLGLVDGKRSIAEIAADLKWQHPDHFEYDEDAIGFVRDVVKIHGDTILLIDD